MNTPEQVAHDVAPSAVGRRLRFSFNDLKIGRRIALLLVLPIAVTLWFAANTLLEKRAVVTSSAEIERLATLAAELSRFVDAMQRERGVSALFLGTKGASYGAEVKDQRTKTDAARAALEKMLTGYGPADFGDLGARQLQVMRTTLQGLGKMRSQVDGAKIAPGVIAAYYSKATGAALDIIQDMADRTDNAKTANAIVGYVAFLQAADRAGQERAVGASGFGAGKFSVGAYRAFVKAVAEQDTFLSVFRAESSGEDVTAFDEAMSSPDATALLKMRDVAINFNDTNSVAGITGPKWFEAASKRIDLFKAVADQLGQSLHAQTASALEAAQNEFLVLSVTVGALLLVTIALGWYVIRGISRPLGDLTAATGELAGGNLEVEIALRETRDEVGTLVRAIKVLKDNLLQGRQREAESREAEKRAAEAERQREEESRATEARMAEERRAADERAKEERRKAMLDLADSFEARVGKVVGEVTDAAGNMRTTAETMSATAEETNRQATTVAAAAEQASANVQTVASAAEELFNSIQEIGRQVAQSSSIAHNAVEEAKKTNTKVQGLAEAAQKIGEVVSLITDIASQTNLLALNATIEAARAGEAGKGFAVVATEVKSLANQTAKATEEIAGQIGAIQSATGEAVHAIQGIGTTIAEISEIATAIASAVEEQGAATREIAGNVQQAASGTREVTENITGVTRAAGETGEATGQVVSAANALAEHGRTLQHAVDDFLKTVRAA